MDLHTLWTGAPLGWFQRLCLASMVAQGHDVVLWSYDELDNLPEGVRLAPAGKVLPASKVIRHKEANSLSLFSNRFRYELLRAHQAGASPVTWTDIDVLFLKPLTDTSPMLFGWEDDEVICTAILRLPADAPVLADIHDLAMARTPVPFWWPRKVRIAQRLAGWFGRHTPPQEMPWGTFGPQALTKGLKRHGLDHLAQPPHVFYPVHWTEAELFFKPAEVLESRVRPETVAVHLWGHACLRLKRDGALPASSWLATMCARHGIEAA